MGAEQSQNDYQQAPSGDNPYPGNARRGSYSNSSSSVSSSTGGGGTSGVGGDAPATPAERAAALEAKLGKRRAKPKDQAAIKDAHWKRYNELDKAVDPLAPPSAPSPTAASQQPGFRLADSAPVARNATAPVPTYAQMPAQPVAPGMIPGINRSSAPPTAAQLLHGQKRYETPEEAAIRAQRAAAFSQPAKAKAAKAAAGKEERWKAYSQFEQAASSSSDSSAVIVNAPLPFGFPSSSPQAPVTPVSSDFYRTPTPGSAVTPTPSAPAYSGILPLQPTPPPIAAQRLDPLFQKQMNYLVAKVKAMPVAAVSLLRKIIQNLLKAGPNPDAEGKKFRKVKLNNPKIQESVVGVDGAMELLLTIGFEYQELPSASDPTTPDDYLVFPDNHTLDIAQLAYSEMSALVPTSPPGQ